jgi:hypothetical protein
MNLFDILVRYCSLTSVLIIYLRLKISHPYTNADTYCDTFDSAKLFRLTGTLTDICSSTAPNVILHTWAELSQYTRSVLNR